MKRQELFYVLLAVLGLITTIIVCIGIVVVTQVEQNEQLQQANSELQTLVTKQQELQTVHDTYAKQEQDLMDVTTAKEKELASAKKTSTSPKTNAELQSLQNDIAYVREQISKVETEIARLERLLQ